MLVHAFELKSFLDDSDVDMCTNPLATNPLCVVESHGKKPEQNGAVLVQNSSM
jgi:hypothetical protein